jgi:hypothetical protein
MILATNSDERSDLPTPKNACEAAGAGANLVSSRYGTVRAWREKKNAATAVRSMCFSLPRVRMLVTRQRP